MQHIYTLHTGTSTHLNTNIYINLKYLTTIDSFINVFNNPKITSNIKDTPTFTSDLMSFELASIDGKNKNTNNSFGMLFTILLDSVQDNEYLTGMTQKIINKLDMSNYPYYSFLVSKGKGEYLSIYISERLYYPRGTLQVVKAKQNGYKSLITGRTCKDQEKGAYLYRKKGDIIRQKKVKFSSKNRKLKLNQHQFTKYIDNLKLWYANENKTKVLETISFKRYRISLLNNKQKRVARVWANSFNMMENSFYNLYEKLTYGGNETIDTNAKKELDRLFITYNSQVINNYQYYDGTTKNLKRFRYSKAKFNIDFNANYSVAKDNSLLLLDRFNKDLDKIKDKYLIKENEYILNQVE